MKQTIKTAKTDVLYARYSSHAQDDSTSIEVQIEACERAAGNPLTRYIDRAKTGRTMGGRTELLRLISDAESGKIGKCYVYKFDRLGRAASTHVLVDDLEQAGVEVISVTEGTNALARGVQLVVAADYSRALAERTRAGLIKRHEQRAWTGGRPCYGLRVVDVDGVRRLAINETEAKAVRYLFDTYLAEPVGMKILARRLEAKGFQTRKGAPWTFTTIKGILQNPMVTGEIIYHRRSMKLQDSGRRVHRSNDPSTHLTYREESLRIISDEQFAKVQQRIGTRNSGPIQPRAALAMRVWTGQLFCSVCRSPFYSKKSRNTKGEYHYYSCGCRQRKGPTACLNAASLREDHLLLDFQQMVDVVMDNRDRLIEKSVAKAKVLMDTHREDAARLRAELRELDKHSDGLMRLMLDPAITEAAKVLVSRQMEQTAAKLLQVQASLDALTDRGLDNTAELASEIGAALDEARAAISAASSPAALNQLIGELLGPSLVLPDGSIVAASDMETATAGAVAGVPSNIAGACSVTAYVQAICRSVFRAVKQAA
jgi:site-specific DNA recombinase